MGCCLMAKRFSGGGKFRAKLVDTSNCPYRDAAASSFTSSPYCNLNQHNRLSQSLSRAKRLGHSVTPNLVVQLIFIVSSWVA
jgi:hypothetical protein